MPDPATEIDIDYVANLARIALTPEEKARYGAQLGNILGHFQRLREVDVTGIEPSAHAFDLENVWQEDTEARGLTPDEALRNAPARRENQIVVPKVVDDA
jgi:aspartyl-tRNA(Asn)/glutamyl-tRNA(Gln) amidotransferase subunit C